MVIPQDFNYILTRLNETLQYFIIYFGSERVNQRNFKLKAAKADQIAMYGVIYSH